MSHSCNENEELPLIYVTSIQSSAIKTLVEVLKDVLADVNVIFDATGISIASMDPTSVSLIQVKLNAERFEKYHCPSKQILGISMSSLYKLIKSTSNSDSITFELKSNNTGELIICIENADKNSRTTYNLKLLDLNEETLSIPEVEFEYSMTMPSTDFQRYCRDMQNVSEKVRVAIDENDFLNISCDGDFASQKTVIGETTHGLIFKTKSNNIEYSELFSLKYINLFTKSTNLSNTIEISIKNNYPLILKYSVANLGEIKFCLAPHH